MADTSPIQIPAVTLNDGTLLPEIGLGTYKLRDDEGIASILDGLAVGYRLLDTAVNYENEREVGEAFRRSGLARDEVRITTKIPGRHHGFDEAIASTRQSLTRLGVDRVDLSLIHWPNPSRDRYVDTWRGMIAAREEGLVTSIGVSNFTVEMLERIVEATGVVPVVNQIELHPYFPQDELRRAHARLGVRTESWSPLARGAELLGEPVLERLAARHGVTPAQVVLRWHTQLGSTPIPKSSDAGRQRANADIFGFRLDDADVEAVSSLRRGRLWDGDPLTHEEM